MVKYLVILSCFLLSVSSCVSSKKFSDLEVLKEYYKLKGDTLAMLKKENQTLGGGLSQTKAELAITRADLEATKSNLERQQSQYSALSTEFKLLESKMNNLSASSQSETQSLKSELSNVKRENGLMKSILTNFDKAYQLRTNGGVLANDTWGQKFQRMQEVSETMDAEKAQLAGLFQVLASLPVFEKDGLEVMMANGNVVVRMAADLVFTNSTQVNSTGRKVLKEITGVILRNSNLDVKVEGHTDTKGSDAANWTTSSLRAAAVVKEMIKNDFMPGRLYPVGRSSHHPISAEETSAARKLNRRVELVIEPRTSLR